MDTDKVILGIDPGTNLMGYGVLKLENRLIRPISMGVINLKSINDPYQKMARILQEMNNVLDEYKPDEMAIEAPFYGKNVQSMLKLGRAQGVAIAAALSHGVPVTEYAPRKVKLAITGQGEASKEQVWNMLQLTLKFQAVPESFDASDALAIALCHLYSLSRPKVEQGPKSWEDYIAKNPGSVIR